MPGRAPSVVVPTRNRPQALARCLAALDRQSLAPLEVIVVDDASGDREAVSRVVGGVPAARLLDGAGRGPAAARNAGARDARAPLLCFLDDDCEPDSAWVEQMAAAFERGADAVVGRTVNGLPHRPVAAASQAVVEAVSESTLDRRSQRIGFGPSCNLAARAELMASLPFDERYPLAAGEDREWCRAAIARGHELWFEPGAVVRHRPALSAAGFLRQHERYGRGAYRFHRGAAPSPRRSTGRRHRVAPLQRLILRRALRQGPAVTLLVCAAQLATLVGFAREARRPGSPRRDRR